MTVLPAIFHLCLVVSEFFPHLYDEAGGKK
jgi:hypothetical protein